jgi:hypothetical protein
MAPLKRSIPVVTALLILGAIYILHVRKDMTDFEVCYKGGQRILDGETIYRQSDGHLQYKYSPPSALFFAPFALFPLEAAKIFWYILECVFLVGISILSLRLIPNGIKNPAGTLIWTYLIMLKLLAREFELGQVNLLILFLLTLAVYLSLLKKGKAAGLAWGASLFFKPYALVMLPYFLIKKKFVPIASGLALFAVGLAAPATIYGFKGTITVLEEWTATLAVSTRGLLTSYDNASLYGFLLKALPEASPGIAGIGLGLAGLILALALLWLIGLGGKAPASQKPEVLESAFLFILIPLFSPLGWNYNYLYSLLAVMMIVNTFPGFPFALKIVLVFNFAVIGTSLVEIWGRPLFHFYTAHALVAVNFLLVLCALACLRLKSVH